MLDFVLLLDLLFMDLADNFVMFVFVVGWLLLFPVCIFVYGLFTV